MSRLTKAADKILRQGMGMLPIQSVENRILANSKVLKVEPGEFSFQPSVRNKFTFIKVMLKHFIKSMLKMKLIQWE